MMSDEPEQKQTSDDGSVFWTIVVGVTIGAGAMFGGGVLLDRWRESRARRRYLERELDELEG
jgi:hypothetical protein